MPVFGASSLSTSGNFIICNKLSLKALQMLEDTLKKDNITYLAEAGTALDSAIISYLESSPTDGIIFNAGRDDLNALRETITNKLQAGKNVVFLPGKVPHIKGAIGHIAPRVMRTLAGLHISPIPVHVGFYSNSVIDAELDNDKSGDIQIHILPKLTPGPEMPARLTAAWLECSAQNFSTLPQLHDSLALRLFRSLKQHSECRIIDGIDDTNITFGQMLVLSISFALRLKKLTNSRRIGIILPPGKGATMANIACLFAGKTPVNFNYTTSEAAFRSSIRQADVSLFITADTFMRKLQSFPWPPKRDLLLLETEFPIIRKKARNIGIWMKFFGSRRYERQLRLNDISGNDEAVLMFTSGSSGEPKGAALTNHNILSNIAQCSSRITIEPHHRFLSSLPVFHCFGITIGLFYPLLSGNDMVTYPSPLEAKRLGTLTKNYKCSLIVTTPTFLRSFIKRCEADTFESVNYLIVGAEKLPQEIAKAFYDKFSIMPLEGYGLTEASPVCAVNLPSPMPASDTGDYIPSHRPGTVGALLPGIAVRITDPHTGTPIPINHTGMIWLKGPNIFHGYLGNTRINNEIFVDGWLKTGDIGSADEFGFLKIEGRLARFSKIGGEMVPHEALEHAIMKIWGLDPGAEHRSIAVVTIPDSVKGEAIALLTTEINSYFNQALTRLRNDLSAMKLPPLWCPREIIPVERIPELPSGKLDLKQCKMLAYEALGLPLED